MINHFAMVDTLQFEFSPRGERETMRFPVWCSWRLFFSLSLSLFNALHYLQFYVKRPRCDVPNALLRVSRDVHYTSADAPHHRPSLERELSWLQTRRIVSTRSEKFFVRCSRVESVAVLFLHYQSIEPLVWQWTTFWCDATESSSRSLTFFSRTSCFKKIFLHRKLGR